MRRGGWEGESEEDVRKIGALVGPKGGLMRLLSAMLVERVRGGLGIDSNDCQRT